MVNTLGPIHSSGGRTTGIPPSSLHKVFRDVQSWEHAIGRDAVGLHVGEPGYRPSTRVVEALCGAARSGHTRYTSAEGHPELITALRSKLRSRNDIDTSPEHIMVTPGSAQGLAALFQALTVSGDIVLLPELHWPVHLQQALLQGLRPVFYPLTADHRPDLSGIRALDTHHARLIVLNSPANPTGAVIPKEDLAELLDLASERDWLVISDEAYEDFVYEGRHVSPAAMENHLEPSRRRVFSAFSFSKSYAMTGYRLGYVVAPNDHWAKAIRTSQEPTILSPVTPVAYAGMAALEDRRTLEENQAFMRHNRDVLLPPLCEAGLLRALPEGGWYAVLDIESTGLGAEKFARQLLDEYGVGVAPMGGFATRPRDGSWLGTDPALTHCVRISFCGPPERLESGVHSIIEFVGTNT